MNNQLGASVSVKGWQDLALAPVQIGETPTTQTKSRDELIAYIRQLENRVNAEPANSFLDIANTLGFSTVQRYNNQDNPIYMGLTNIERGFNPENWNSLGLELNAIDNGKLWLFGDMYKMGVFHGLEPEQIALLGNDLKTYQNFASTASAYPIIAPAELGQISGVLKLLDSFTDLGLKTFNGHSVGLMRFPQFEGSKHTIFNKLDPEFRTGLLLKGIVDNWSVRDCRENFKRTVNHLASIGNPDAQEYFQRKKIFPVPKTTRFSIPVKVGLSRVEVYKLLAPLVDKIMDLPADATEIIASGTLDYLLPPKAE